MDAPAAAVVASVISALVTIFTVIINSRATENKITAELKLNQAVTDEKIRTLTEEVKRHNDFASSIPVMKNDIQQIKDRLELVEHRRTA